jgi:hypothetical protein
MELKISNPSSRRHPYHELAYFHGDYLFESNPILVLNDALDDLKVPYAVNEKTIENFLDDLETFGNTRQSVYWLAMSRLLELTMVCAGHYADNCEFSAAGDLLFNPRKVLIHRQGFPNPLIKQRHGRLTDQLNQEQKQADPLLRRIKDEIRIEVAKPAIMPYLMEGIERSCQIASWYLQDAQERMKKIADTIGFLSAWSLSKFELFHHRMQKMSEKTRRFVVDHQCNFDTSYFVHLGHEIPKIIGDPHAYSEFFP